MSTSFTLPMPPEILTCVGKVAPPIPTIPAFFTISTISSTVRASGSAGAFTSSLTVFWKSFSITTDTMSPPIEKGRGSMAFTVPETLAWMGADTNLSLSPINWPTLTKSPAFTTGVQGAPIC